MLEPRNSVSATSRQGYRQTWKRYCILNSSELPHRNETGLIFFVHASSQKYQLNLCFLREQHSSAYLFRNDSAFKMYIFVLLSFQAQETQC